MITELYPIGTKVKHGNNDGVITNIQISGNMNNVSYHVCYLREDEEYICLWLYDFEFTSNSKKLKIGARL